MTAAKQTIGIIVLAAGASTRLGSPKQLLVYRDKTLLRHTVEEAIHAGVAATVVVLGADAPQLSKEINDLAAIIVQNEAWATGMSSSIRKGLKALTDQHTHLEGAVIMMCDQPFVTAGLLKELISTYKQTGKPIVISHYGEAMGPPAFFHHSFFKQLIELQGDEGAKKIVQQHRHKLSFVNFPQGKIDIDSKADYEKLLQ